MDCLTFVGANSQLVERRTTPSVVPAHAAPMWTTSIRVGTIGSVMDPRAPEQWSLLLRCRHSEEVAIRLHRRFESLVLGFRQSIE